MESNLSLNRCIEGAGSPAVTDADSSLEEEERMISALMSPWDPLVSHRKEKKGAGRLAASAGFCWAGSSRGVREGKWAEPG